MNPRPSPCPYASANRGRWAARRWPAPSTRAVSAVATVATALALTIAATAIALASAAGLWPKAPFTAVAGPWSGPPSSAVAGPPAGPAGLSDFHDGTWVLRVDRVWDRASGNVVFPHDPLEEADYRPVADGPTYPVTVTEDAGAIAIGNGRPFKGVRTEATSEHMLYELDEGTFAGGRVVVRAEDDGLQAELTQYGSGLPIVKSERGALEPTYFVATDGSDLTGTGSINEPWATIAHAVNSGIPAAGGATVIVRDGEYRGLNTLARGFPARVTVRAEHPYRATLTNVDGGAEAIRIYVVGPARLVIEGFVLTNRHPTNTCEAGREANYLVHIQDASEVELHNNIIFGNNAPGTCNELVKVNRADASAYPRDIRIRGNVFSEPANAPGADMIDAVRPGEIDIVDNVFFSAPDRDRSQSFITLKREAPAPSDVRSPRYRIARNVFLTWGGRPDQAFVQLGEDGVPEYEITDALIENNLFLGDSPAPMAAPIQLKGVRDVRVSANTVIGDLPSGAFALRVGTEGANPTTRDISMNGNIWSDPTGTMGARLVTTYGDVDTRSIGLVHNLFWNGGQPLPVGGAVVPSDDVTAIVADPRLASHEGLIPPRWDAAAGTFASGTRTIRDEFLCLVDTHGAPGPGSPAIDAALPGWMPADDIRGLTRGDHPDLGAFEVGAGTPSAAPTALPTAPPTLTPAPSVIPPACVLYCPLAERR